MRNSISPAKRVSITAINIVFLLLPISQIFVYIIVNDIMQVYRETASTSP